MLKSTRGTPVSLATLGSSPLEYLSSSQLSYSVVTAVVMVGCVTHDGIVTLAAKSALGTPVSLASLDSSPHSHLFDSQLSNTGGYWHSEL